MKKAIISVGLLFAFAIACFAADLTGTWKGFVDVQGSPLELTYKLKADGEKLTGTINSTYGELPLIDGKITGTDFSYKVDIGSGPVESTGKYMTDSIMITSHYGGVETKNTFKRVVE